MLLRTSALLSFPPDELSLVLLSHLVQFWFDLRSIDGSVPHRGSERMAHTQAPKRDVVWADVRSVSRFWLLLSH